MQVRERERTVSAYPSLCTLCVSCTGTFNDSSLQFSPCWHLPRDYSYSEAATAVSQAALFHWWTSSAQCFMLILQHASCIVLNLNSGVWTATIIIFCTSSDFETSHSNSSRFSFVSNTLFSIHIYLQFSSSDPRVEFIIISHICFTRNSDRRRTAVVIPDLSALISCSPWAPHDRGSSSV